VWRVTGSQNSKVSTSLLRRLYGFEGLGRAEDDGGEDSLAGGAGVAEHGDDLRDFRGRGVVARDGGGEDGFGGGTFDAAGGPGVKLAGAFVGARGFLHGAEVPDGLLDLSGAGEGGEGRGLRRGDWSRNDRRRGHDFDGPRSGR